MKKSQKGFTIIEVALVLAIGALIFLVVFLAVPALQRNQRNDARKRDVSNIVQAVADYNSNHASTAMSAGVAYPNTTSASSTLKEYIDNLSTNIDTVNVVKGTTTLASDYTKVDNTAIINVYNGAKCNKDGNGIVKAAGRQSAVVGVMENASNYTIYCQDAS